jgi:uncharacterized protein
VPLSVNLFQNLYYWFLDHYEASYTKRILWESLLLLNQLWPYLVSGIILTTTVKLFVSKQWLAKTFSEQRNYLSIPLAAFLGVLSPLGSYVIIPLGAALFSVGVPLPVLMALMVSSPIINPNLFLLTTGAMGMEMALMRVFSAFLLGNIAGYLTLFMIKKKYLNPDMVLSDESQIAVKNFDPGISKVSWRLFFYDLYRTARWVGRYFFLAIVLAAAIKILANPNYLIRIFNSNTFISVLLSTGAGVPFYVCGGAAIPVVQQLAELGLSKGAVLAFFISGPVTKISNLVVMQSAFRKTILLIYLVVGIGGALVLGLLYNLF